MNDTLGTKPKRTRLNRKPATPCSREGCNRIAPKGDGRLRYCCGVCRAVDTELVMAERICKASGHNPVSGELWLAAVAVNDALTEYQRLDTQLCEVAGSVGISVEQWHSLRHGEHSDAAV
jgi:hypothetical protein